MNLQERAFCATLRLSRWGGTCVDEEATQETLKAHHAPKDAGKFIKVLVPEDEIRKVVAVHSAARQTFYRCSLPWLDRMRIISAETFFEFRAAMHKEEQKCLAAHAAFCRRYAQLLAEAPARLGSMFNPADYPSPQEMASRFAFAVTITPVPDKKDFRMSIGADEEAELAARYEREMAERLGTAQREVYGRLSEVVEHLADQSAGKGKFYEVTLEKVANMARLAPKNSLVPDPKLEEICGNILATVQGLSAEDVRKSKTVRAHVASKAKATMAEIENAMAGVYFKAAA